MTVLRALGAASLALALSACASMGRPGQFGPQATLLDPHTLGAGSAIGAAQGAPAWPGQAWWQDLRDPQLNRLMQLALSDNPGLHLTLARVRQAGALAGLAEDNTGVKADASVALNRELYSGHGSTPAPLAGHYAWRNQATLAGSYDLDLWGRNRQALAAALDEVQLASAEAQLARLALETAVARSYIQLSFEFKRQEVIEASLAQRERILELAHRRRQAGLGTEVDIAQIETTLPAGRREREQSQEAIALLRNQLAALCGKGPADGETITRPALALTGGLGLPSALPAELIGRRPDIAAQRWRVEAAAKRIDVAKAEFYPNLNLIAFAGFQSFGFAKFLDANSEIGGIAPALSLPIFAGARLRAQLGKQNAIYDGAVEQYNATVVQALEDVANVIVRLRSLKQQRRLNEVALASANKAHQLAERAYRAGISDASGMLNTHISLLNEQQQMAQNGARELDGYVSLMAALGGGI
ncbi:NodT family efflux transporter outer membrane factor (OMF) lipoprotein [Oxalobacteraceae bacterium GrIS 1.11]